ncbi:MAG: HAMP domain-containing histidine kinase [Candidatus Magnetominusculus sp. LBB02]|nr:HAMP domain-containing histidine kinase [Candidatus Magnetominusculus sp. LBB02]
MSFVGTAAVVVLAALAVVGAAFLYLRALIASRFAAAILEISDLNEQVQCVAEAFLSEIHAYLNKIWVRDFSYDISYGDTHFKKELSAAGCPVTRAYDGGDLKISFTIVPISGGFGLKTLYSSALEHIFLIIRQDMVMKHGTLNDALTNALKIQVFVQHDIKNIAQFIQTSYYNLQNLKDEADELRYVRHLKESYTPLMLKANKIINTMELKPSDKPVPLQTIKIEAIVQQLVSLYHLECEVKGTGSVYANEGTIFLIFDNLVKNMYDKYLEEELEMSLEIIDEGDNIRVSAFDSGSPIKDIDKIFEPFYTTKTGGSGIGLYQIRTHVTKLGGTITAANVENGVIFDITLPKANSSDTL